MWNHDFNTISHKKTDINMSFAITRLQNGQIPGVNEWKRRRKLAFYKGM